MYGEFLFGSHQLEMHYELLAQILASTVQVQEFYVGIVLGFTPGFKVFVCVEGFTFLVQEMQVC
jgi:hypothetical protein